MCSHVTNYILTFIYSFILSTSSHVLTSQRNFLCNNLAFQHSPSRHSPFPQLYWDCSPTLSLLSHSGGSFSFCTLFYPSAEFNGNGFSLLWKIFIPTVTPLCLDFPSVHSFSFFFTSSSTSSVSFGWNTSQSSDSFILGPLLSIHGLWRQIPCAQIPDLALTSCVTCGKSLLFVFQFCHL